MPLGTDIGKSLGDSQRIVCANGGLLDDLDVLVDEDQRIFVDDHLEQPGIQKLGGSGKNNEAVHRSGAHAENCLLLPFLIVMRQSEEKMSFSVAGIGDGGDGLKTEMSVHFRIDQSDPGKKITGKRRSFGEIAACRSGSLVTYKGSAALLPG